MSFDTGGLRLVVDLSASTAYRGTASWSLWNGYCTAHRPLRHVPANWVEDGGESKSAR